MAYLLRYSYSLWDEKVVKLPNLWKSFNVKLIETRAAASFFSGFLLG